MEISIGKGSIQVNGRLAVTVPYVESKVQCVVQSTKYGESLFKYLLVSPPWSEKV